MDYKEKYEAMVQRARELHEAGNALTKQQMEIVCPELAESEDKRVNEEIRNFLIDMECKREWIAYLGKQKVQKPKEDKDAIEPTPKQDYSGLSDFERAIHRGFLCAGVENVPVGIIKETAQDCLAHIEQKPADWDDELEKCKKHPLYFYDKYVKIKLKPAEWSEEDEEHLKSIISTIEMCMKDCENANYVLGYYDSDITWLKSLRSRLKKTE